MDRDLVDLKHLKSRLPSQRNFSEPIQLSVEKQINHLLGLKTTLQELEIETPSEKLKRHMLTADQVTASQIHVERIRTVSPRLELEEKNLFGFLQEMPKCEIHLHMEACISRQTLLDLLEKHGVEHEKEKIERMYQFKNLQEFISLFLFILDAIRSPDDFHLIFNSLRKYLEENQIHYAEVFLAPSRMISNGLDFHEIAETIDSLASECVRTGGPEVKYLIDVSRTFGSENASKNLQRILKLKTTNIIGIGLGGAELMGPARDFKDVFAQARSEGLRCVTHAGEDDGPWSIRDSIEILQAERIGHGTSAIQDPSLIELLKGRSIPLEICLTSNVFTGKYVREEKDHPVRYYYDQGLICSVNTDDPEIFNINLSEEFFKYYKHLGFSITELIDLNRQGVYSTFHPHPASMWKQFEEKTAKLRKKYSV